MRARRCALSALLGLAVLGVAPGGARADTTLQAGVGRADITPPTGYYTQGWVRSDAKGTGQLTRLFARVIVLQRGNQKLALVAEDLNGIAGGMLADAAERDADLGFNQGNVLDSASHTHAAEGGYFNFSTYNTVAPTPNDPSQFSVSFDPQLYGFLVDRLALAIRRAAANLGPARLGWGHTELLGVTENRSLEAHLANFGIQESPGTGNAAQDPGGYPDTIDPNVDVLRVDKLLGGLGAPASTPGRCRTVRVRRHGHRLRIRRCTAGRAGVAQAARVRAPRRRRLRPHRLRAGSRWATVGLWTEFADHGTVIKSDFPYYNADHHGEVIRNLEDAMRSEGRVPANQDVVGVYGNSDAGDMSAGLHQSGPAAADAVGRREADAMLAAWHQAAGALTSTPALDVRWTRLCFCGQTVDGQPTATSGAFGLPQLTGSEEGRGGLYQLTGVSFEGDHMALSSGPQGDKIIDVPDTGSSFPKAVPIMAARIGDRMLVSEPAEPTVEVGKRLRDAVLGATGSAGITRAIVVGYANEYISYLTTPAEYDTQNYEGGSTLYGRLSSVLVQEADVDLARRLVGGQPPPAPYAYDPANGVRADETPFPTGASSASITTQPTPVQRLSRAGFAWQGGPKGEDRPLDTAFVHIVRQVGSGWQPVTDDLGLQVLWSGDANGAYGAEWQVPLDVPAGSYAFRVTANHYTLQSAPFTVSPATSLSVSPAPAAAGQFAVSLGYPAPQVNVDLTDRPGQATGGTVRFLVDGAARPVSSRGAVWSVSAPETSSVTVPAGAAQDAYGNSNAQPLQVNPPPPGGDVPGRP